MKHRPEPGFDAMELAALEAISRSLRADGWAEHVTVQGLLRDWRELAGEADQYVATIDDYTNDLTGRDALDAVLSRCEDPLRAKLKHAIGTADAEFLARTVEDAEQTLGRYFRIGPSSAWWWRRRPRAGPLADYLAGP